MFFVEGSDPVTPEKRPSGSVVVHLGVVPFAAFRGMLPCAWETM